MSNKSTQNIKGSQSFLYSSKDYVTGTLGIFIKLLAGLIIYVMSLSIQLTVFSPFMYFSSMKFIMLMSIYMLLFVWGTAILLKNKKNVFKLLIIFAAIIISYFISPYNTINTFVILVMQIATALIALHRMNLPEKIGLSITLVMVSCFLFCFLQIIFVFRAFKNDSALQMKSIIMTAGIIWIMISIFILNIINIKRLSYEKKKLSKGLLYGNIAQSVLFVGLILIIASIHSYKEMIINIFRKIIIFILMAINYIMETLTATNPMDNDSTEFSQIAKISEPSELAQFMENALIVVIFLIFAISFYFMVKKLIKMLIKGFKLLFNYLQRNDSQSARFEFTDIEESTFDKKQLNKEIQNRLEKLKNHFKRKPRLSDMKNNKEKVRFIYKLLLQKNASTGKSTNKNITAREMLSLEQLTTDKKTFLNGYEKARYSTHKVSNSEVEAGINLLNSKS